MKNVTVDLNAPSLYAEPDNFLYRFKRKLTYNNILNKIRQLMRGNETFSILEIGTGSGFFMAFLETAFPKANIYGLEFDDRLIELTKNKVSNAIIMQGNAEDFTFKDIKFDLIVSFQVIEHLYQPEAMVNNVKKHLKDEGIFVFTTPNLESISARFLKEKWHGFRDDHVSLKSYGAWIKWMKTHDFVPIYTGSTFFSGIPILNKFPLGVFNWGLLYIFGSLKWKHGESFVGVFNQVKK